MVNQAWLNRNNIYYFSLALMLIALPLSKFLMSVAQFIMVFNWLFDRRIIEKWKAFFRNRPAVVLVSIYLLHIIGLLWTSDFDYALKDLRVKLPLLALPIIIATSPKISDRIFHYLILLFIAANVVGSLFSMHHLLTSEISDIREISLFISHIRFSLNICIAIFGALYLVFRSSFFNRSIKFLLLLMAVWLLGFLAILESITGLGIFLMVTFLLFTILIFKSRKPALKWSLVVAMIAIPAVMFFYLRNIYLDYFPQQPFIYQGMDEFTAQGNRYYHYEEIKGAENGNWIGQYIQMDELKSAWNQRSTIHFDTTDRAGHYVRYTLLRYLTSKGLRKDAEGMAALTDDDIRNIENGIANVRDLTKSSFENRLRTIVWEMMLYRKSGYLSGHSVAQRLEFWRAGYFIFKDNFWIGTGTGDISNAFKEQYVKMDSQLEERFRWRSHNQYMSMLATFGIFGLLWFLIAMVWPPLRLGMFSDYYFLTFFAVLMLSMITEDTIESQAGATFFAFFMAFFLFARESKERVNF
jgi:hypothetical protein